MGFPAPTAGGATDRGGLFRLLGALETPAAEADAARPYLTPRFLAVGSSDFLLRPPARDVVAALQQLAAAPSPPGPPLSIDDVIGRLEEALGASDGGWCSSGGSGGSGGGGGAGALLLFWRAGSAVVADACGALGGGAARWRRGAAH